MKHLIHVDSIEELIAGPAPHPIPEILEEPIELYLDSKVLLLEVNRNIAAFTQGQSAHPPQSDADRAHDAHLLAHLTTFATWLATHPNELAFVALRPAAEYGPLSDTESDPE